MSYGALNLGDRYLSLSSEVVQATDFESAQYLSSNPLLAQGFGIPESAIPELNKIIGRFLMAIQEASFIHRSVLEVVPMARNDWQEAVYSHEPLAYSSTLSANTLVVAVRQNIERLIQDVLALTTGLDNDDTPESPTEKPAVQNWALLFSNNIGHKGELDYTDLLTDEARNLIDQFGAGCANAVHHALQVLAESILCRADLSFGSLRRDVTRLAEEPQEEAAKTSLPKDATYSTLNPVDLISMVKRNLEFAPIGLAMGLPDEIKKEIFARLPKSTESGAPAPVTT